MASPIERASPGGAGDVARQDSFQEQTMSTTDRPSTPKQEGHGGMNCSAESQQPSATSAKTPKRALTKKKVPWKGKNIIVSIPLDEERGQPGKKHMPMDQATAEQMMRSWEQLGYNISGFDLDTPRGYAEPGEYSQSRGAWPDPTDLVRERSQRSYQVTLPDLNAWRKYVDELNEAKLRALGVSFGDDDPPQPSLSPVSSAMSRQPSVTHYPLPFSPPLPTSSASSSHMAQGFPFPGAFNTAAGQSPGIPSAASPASFLPKTNPRASISLPSPQGWSPQFALQHRGSPSLANLNAIMSPTSPFSPDLSGPGLHQRHQSLQYPMLPHQFQQPTRATPRLQDLREDEEEEIRKSPSQTPEPQTFVRQHNASNSLQREIDEAEYHLEEQMRSQLDNDEDYSPHNDNDKMETVQSAHPHARDSSVQFAPQAPLFTAQADGHVLHHPRPHSRGHSLSQKYFTEEDANTHLNPFKMHGLQDLDTRVAVESEVDTNPSNLGTPIQPVELSKLLHQRSFSTASNPWADESAKSLSGSRRPSHGSKASLSKLNVDAPEYKFNPTSNFEPGKFSFGANTFQPVVFNAGVNGPPSATSSQFGLPSSQSVPQMGAKAAVFSPGQSNFSFSSSGPMLHFRPDAPSFTPVHSFSNSVTSPTNASGAESKRASSIFGNIDLSGSDIVKQPKKSKAIPIVRPTSRQSPKLESSAEGSDGRPTDNSRVKRVRGVAGEDDSVARFAEGPEEATPVPETIPQASQEADIPAEEKSGGEDSLLQADTVVSSTMVSETSDAKPTASPSEVSPDQAPLNWTPFEFESKADLSSFNNARPIGEDVFTRGHKKSLSATAKDFVPGVGSWGAQAVAPVEDMAGDTDAPDESDDEIAKELLDESTIDQVLSAPVDDQARETEQIPIAKSIEVAMDEPINSVEEEPAQANVQVKLPPIPSASPLPTPSTGGLGASRFASTPSAQTPPTATPAKGLSASRYASTSSPPGAPELKKSGLSRAQFAASPSPIRDEDLEQAQRMVSPLEPEDAHLALPLPKDSLLPVSSDERSDGVEDKEPSMEQLDAIMRHLNQNPSMGVNKATEQAPQWHQPSPNRHIPLAAITNESPLPLPPHTLFRSDAPSPSPKQYRKLAVDMPNLQQPMLSTELEDPFVDPPPQSADSFEAPVHHLNPSEGLPASDWEGAFSYDEQVKLESRVNFFDGHVNELVDGLLAARLEPMEHALDSIKHALVTFTRGTPSSRRDRRSISAEFQESDADDEDEEMPVRRSMSPRRDKKWEQIRAAVLDAFAVQQRNAPAQGTAPGSTVPVVADNSAVLEALEAMKAQFEQSLHLDFRGEDLRNIVEDAVEKRMPQTPQPVIADETAEKMDQLQARIAELENRLRAEELKVEREFNARQAAEDQVRHEQAHVEVEVATRRAAEDRAADLDRKLQTAETRIEVEIMNKSIFDQRVVDLEDRLNHQDAKLQEESNGRTAAEDRLSEVQRLLRISSEEEDRLREELQEREQKIKSMEATAGKSAMRLALLEAGQSTSEQSHSELQNRHNVLEVDLRDARQEARHWRGESDRLNEVVRRIDDELAHTTGENKALHKLIDTLGVQLQEIERVRDSWRSKFITLQDEMALAAREITEENARRSKKEQALIARQEVLDAKLQAEARTRERIETELERLELGERQGMRAVAENKRLEGLLAEMCNDNHKLQQTALRFQAEFQEARDSAAREVQRTRESMQAEIEAANHQVNVVRDQLEDQTLRLRAQLDQVKLDADTARAHHDMLLEEAQTTKFAELQDLARKHQNEIEDMQARYERQLGNTTEDAQRQEQNLLERLSISTSKCEYLQDKVVHLEEKLEIVKAAALAAAQAAKSSAATPAQAAPQPVAYATVTPAPAPVSAPASQPKAVPTHLQLPEKISPQALRESIMVLQEQLQEREQKIEELETAFSKVDPEASTKITKRDDEITWLREILAVRRSDLQDIIVALGPDDYDRQAVKDAAIRLEANLQMEEQERERRERAMNGASAISLPNIAATIRDATPRGVAQAVGPLAAAWGNWRKSNQGPIGSISNVLNSPAQAASNRSTPAKNGSVSQGGLLGGLLTPPASGLRQTPPNPNSQAQPTAFSNTGRRFTAQDLANRPRPSAPKSVGKMPMRVGSPSGSRGLTSAPMTPPMMRPSSYDDDAQAEDFDDAGFFDDD